MRWRGFAAAVAATGLMGCGASQPGNAKTTVAPTPVVAGDPAVKPLPKPGRFHTAGLADYAGTAHLDSDPLELRLRTVLKRSIEPPASLDCVAREHAARFAADGRDPTPGATQAIAGHCGYWGRPNHTRSATAKSEADLIVHFQKIPIDKIPGAIAVGVARNPDGRVTGTLVVPPAELRLEPVPRAPTGPVTLRGRLLRGDGTLEVWIDDGAVRELPIKADSAGRFEAQLPAPKGTAPVIVEIVRKQGLFRRTMGLMSLNLPRQAGYAARAAVSRSTPQTRPAPAALIAALNKARVAAKVAPLRSAAALHTRLDGWLARLATGESTGGPPGMLDDRGWPFALTRYGFSAGVDAEEAIALLIDTPTGARALLDPAVDQVGIGTRAFARGVGFDAIFLGLARFESSPAADVREVIHARLTPARTQASKDSGALADNANLEAIAQRIADDVMAGRIVWKQAIPALMDTIRAQRPVRGAFGAGGFTTADPSRVALLKLKHAFDPAMQHIGLGIASGPLPGGGAPRYVIMYIVAEKLPGDG
ncbi:MAG: hypothetical protein ACI9U2_004856 [Bradymonadia bacterium]|jgi:hypothetical protein